MSPPIIGDALTLPDLPTYRDCLITGRCDLKIQDFIRTNLLFGGWQGPAQAIRRARDVFRRRLGLHGPFVGVAIDTSGSEIGPVITRRHLTGLEIYAALGASQMVRHSPHTTLDHPNVEDHPRDDARPSARKCKIAAVQELKGPVVRRSKTMALSIDTGHAHYANDATGAHPVDCFVTLAGADLAHVHLQDADGSADRHWAPERGTVNWHAVFGAIAALPVQPHLVLELRHAADLPAAMDCLTGEGLVR